MIRPIQPQDTQSICDIYNYYVANTIVTFDEQDIPVETMKDKIAAVTEKGIWNVYEVDGRVAGYAYANMWKTKPAYRFCMETTVYIDPEMTGKGIGPRLYADLIEQISSRDIHAVIAVLAIPNEPSRKMHERFGFEKTGHFREVGYKFGKWIDVGYWQLRI